MLGHRNLRDNSGPIPHCIIQMVQKSLDCGVERAVVEMVQCRNQKVYSAATFLSFAIRAIRIVLGTPIIQN
jgi:hypothetical protein